MTESSNGYSTSRERTVGVSAQVRAREVAPEQWEKSESREPNGRSRNRVWQSQVAVRVSLGTLKIGGNAFDHALSFE